VDNLVHGSIPRIPANIDDSAAVLRAAAVVRANKDMFSACCGAARRGAASARRENRAPALRPAAVAFPRCFTPTASAAVTNPDLSAYICSTARRATDAATTAARLTDHDLA